MIAQIRATRWLCLIVMVCFTPAHADDPASGKPATPATAQLKIPAPPLPDNERSAMIKHYTEMVESLTTQIEKDPKSVGLYSRRGDAYMFLAEFGKSEADYEKMIALDPELFAPHWRLGIAYYYREL